MNNIRILRVICSIILMLVASGCEHRPAYNEMPVAETVPPDNLLTSALPARKVFGVHDARGLPPLGAGEITAEGWLRPDRFFSRFATTLSVDGESIFLDKDSGTVKASGQLVLVIGESVFSIRPDQVDQAIAGFTLGLDVVDEDLYAGRAWVVARACDGWAPLADRLLPIAQLAELDVETLHNGKVVFAHGLADLELDYRDLVSYISTTQPLSPGDLICLGPPQVRMDSRPVLQSGDRLGARLGDVLELENPVIEMNLEPDPPDPLLLPEGRSTHLSQGVERYLRFKHAGEVHYGRIEGEEVQLLHGDLFSRRDPTGIFLPRTTLEILPPLVPGKIFCITRNSVVDEALSTEQVFEELPERIRVKAASSVVLTGNEILLPAESRNLDWEAELAIVIGKEARHVAIEDAMDYVFGFIAGNDVSENNWGGLAGKSYDTWAVVGEELVSGINWRDLHIEAWVNGERVQSGALLNRRYPVEGIVAFLSTQFTLLPGDMIYSGTVDRMPDSPPAFKDGDYVEVIISNVGRTQNRVRRVSQTPGRPD